MRREMSDAARRFWLDEWLTAVVSAFALGAAIAAVGAPWLGVGAAAMVLGAWVLGEVFAHWDQVRLSLGFWLLSRDLLDMLIWVEADQMASQRLERMVEERTAALEAKAARDRLHAASWRDTCDVIGLDPDAATPEYILDSYL